MTKPPADEVIRDFPRISAIDSCSVTNLLSSRRLTNAAYGRNLHFVLADYVYYECVVKRRTKPSSGDDTIRARLRDALADRRHVSKASLDVADLQELARLRTVRQIGRGELAAIVLAQKNRMGFVTEDAGARKLVTTEYPGMMLRTTSHLAGWLVHGGHLSDSDIPEIVRENKEVRGERGNIGKYIQACYLHALTLRLKDRLL